MLRIEASQDRLALTHRPVAETLMAIAATLVFGALAWWFFAQGNDAGVIFLIFAVSGPVYLFFFVQSRAALFDRGAGTVTLTTRSARGHSEAVHALAGLARAEVHRAAPPRAEKVVDADLATVPRGAYRTVLLFEDGTELALSDGFDGGKAAFEETRAVNRWLEQG